MDVNALLGDTVKNTVPVVYFVELGNSLVVIV